MKVRHTDDRNIYFAEADPVALWALGIVEFRIDSREQKFIITPIYRDGHEGSDFEFPGGWETVLPAVYHGR